MISLLLFSSAFFHQRSSMCQASLQDPSWRRHHAARASAKCSACFRKRSNAQGKLLPACYSCKGKGFIDSFGFWIATVWIPEILLLKLIYFLGGFVDKFQTIERCIRRPEMVPQIIYVSWNFEGFSIHLETMKFRTLDIPSLQQWFSGRAPSLEWLDSKKGYKDIL